MPRILLSLLVTHTETTIKKQNQLEQPDKNKGELTRQKTIEYKKVRVRIMKGTDHLCH